MSRLQLYAWGVFRGTRTKHGERTQGRRRKSTRGHGDAESIVVRGGGGLLATFEIYNAWRPFAVPVSVATKPQSLGGSIALGESKRKGVWRKWKLWPRISNEHQLTAGSGDCYWPVTFFVCFRSAPLTEAFCASVVRASISWGSAADE